MIPLAPKPVELARLIRDDYRGELSADFHRDLGSAEYSVVHTDEHRILICRGSDEKRDWLRNFWFVRSSWREQGANAEWHGGFLKGAREIWDDLGDERHSITCVTGHSKGAAEAAIIGLSLSKERSTPSLQMSVPTIVFACPRYSYGRTDGPVIHYRRLDDLVTWVPPWCKHRGVVRTVGSWRWGETHRISHYIRALEVAA